MRKENDGVKVEVVDWTSIGYDFKSIAITASDGDDHINASRLTLPSGNFVQYSIHSGLGNDLVIGRDGRDEIRDSGGNSEIYAGGGNDSVVNIGKRGGASHLDGGDGNDTIRAGLGNDRVIGGQGNDWLYGEDGNDHIEGGAGDDHLQGDNGDDRLEGGAGHDNLRGDDGNDYLAGGSGNDNLSGGFGNDRLEGGSGNDRLNGNEGSDILVGGSGADTFVFSSHLAYGGIDTLLDFRAGEDKIALDDAIFRALGKRVDAREFARGNEAATKYQHLLLDDDGALYYDADGAGGASAVQIATIHGTALDEITHQSFQII